MRTKEIHTILYFLDYGNVFGGAAYTLLQQAVLMKKAGYAVWVFLSDYYGTDMRAGYQKICDRYNIKVLCGTFQISSQPEDIDVICLDENYDAMKKRIQQIAPDILHSVQINPMTELIGRELGIPHIMNIYPLLPEFFTLHYMDIFPQYHICDSWYWAKQWNQYLDTDYTCIRTTVNTDTCVKRTVASKEAVRYICVGSIYRGKNQLNVIKAFHAALNEGINGNLSVWGYDGSDYAQECKKYIKDNGLAENITVEGFCHNMEQVYRESDVLICGSIRESYPNAISEAMAFGLVVISTPVAGVPEIVQDGINGYLADGYTAELISRKIIEFYHDIGKEKLENIRNHTYETFLQNHSPKAVTDGLKQFYFHVMQEDKRKTYIMIKDIREAFFAWKKIYYQNYDCFSEPQKVSKKIWYLFHAKEYIESAVQGNVRVYVWGTGKASRTVKEILDVFFPEISISGFLDSRQTGQFDNYKIYKPENVLQKENTVIFVAEVKDQDEIIKQLENNNFIYNRNYFILSNRMW